MLNGKWVPLEAAPLPPPAGPNDRVNVAFIGFGIRGNILMEAVKKTGQANLVAVSDCYQGHLTRAKERTEGKIDTNFAQYKALLDRKDIDAVILAPPDHQHLPMVLDALAAGKDVYIEKPMTHRVEDGPKMIEAVQRYNRVLQAGSQGRSSFLQKKAREIVASGQLGKVTKIIASYNRNSSTGAWNYPIPPDLKEGVNFNWKEWLGNAPKCAYDPERVFRYRKYWDYSGGISTDLFVHLITSIHFIMDAKVPSSVMAAGESWSARMAGKCLTRSMLSLFIPRGSTSTWGQPSTMPAPPSKEWCSWEPRGPSRSSEAASSLLPENPRESYGYSIDSWPKDLQDEFMNTGDHRDGGKPADHRGRYRHLQRPGHGLSGAAPAGISGLRPLAQRMQRKRRGRPPCCRRRAHGQPSYLSGKKMVWDAASDTAREG